MTTHCPADTEPIHHHNNGAAEKCLAQVKQNQPKSFWNQGIKESIHELLRVLDVNSFPPQFDTILRVQTSLQAQI